VTFVISRVVMESAPALNKLDAILKRVEDGVHELEIRDADVLEVSAWYGTCRPERQMLLKKCAQASLFQSGRMRGPHLRRIEVPGQFTVEQAVDLAYTSLRVLLENANSDGALVKFALRAYGSIQTWNLCYEELALSVPPAVEVGSRGGSGELKKLIVQRYDEAIARGIPPRLVVMMDSDGEWVGDIKEHAQAIKDECTARGISCAPLSKRMAENYVPESVWVAWYANPKQNGIRRAIQALVRLTDAQLDYVRFESSNTAPWDKTKQQVAALYAGVDDRDYALLEQSGLKAAAAAALEFALHGGPVWPESKIDNRDRTGDLRRLVKHIEDEL
jgi:hypothetical protein